MDGENKLSDIDYVSSPKQKPTITNVSAPVLDDFGYVDNSIKKGDPTGISAPVLDDMNDFSYHAPERKGMPTGVTAPVLDDDSVPYVAEKHEPEYMTDEEVIQHLPASQIDTFNQLPEANKKKVLELMRNQLGVEAPPEPEEEIKAPVLEDMETEYVYKPRKGMPVLDEIDYDDVAPPEPAKKNVPEKQEDNDVLYMTDEEVIEKFTPQQLETYNNLPPENKQKVLDLMRNQLGAKAPPEKTEEVAAPPVSETAYTPEPEPEKKPVSPIILDDEPEPPKYQPKFVDEDLERAKREGAKQAVSSQLVSDQKDSKESLRMMLELKEERRREEAKKGFKWVIVIAILGIAAASAFYLLYSGSLGLDYKDGIDGIAGILKNSALYITVAMGGTALALVSGINFFKSLASTVFMISGIAQIFPGVFMISQHEGSTGLAIILYAVSVICTISVFFGLSGVESVSLYFKRNEL